MNSTTEAAGVVAVHRSRSHGVGKLTVDRVRLLAGIGVEDDAHSGSTVQHLSRIAADPTRPNLRQVHLIESELVDRLNDDGFDLAPGRLGENLTTHGVDLHALPTGTVLRLGDGALVAITGLRNPCVQLDGVAPGLMAAVRGRDEDGVLVRRCGVMAVVLRGGTVAAGDPLLWSPPPGDPRPLEPV